jgi:hypothetical protein
LLKSKEIDTDVFRKFFKDQEEYSKVLGANVFAYHPSRDTITFQSKSIEAYIQENSSISLKSNPLFVNIYIYILEKNTELVKSI